MRHLLLLCAGLLCAALLGGCAATPLDEGRPCAAAADCAAKTLCVLPSDGDGPTGLCQAIEPGQGLPPRLLSRLVAALPFDEGDGATADDPTDGPFRGSVAAQWTTGRYGGGLRFDGNGGVSLDPREAPPEGSGELLDEVTEGAVTAWVAWDVDNAAGYDPFFSAGDGDGDGDGDGPNDVDGGFLQLALEGDRDGATVDVTVVGPGGDFRVFAKAPLEDPGGFHHIAWLVDRSGNRLLIDGAPAPLDYEAGDAQESAFFRRASNDFTGYALGRSVRADFDGYQGVLDELRIYAKPLTDADVAVDMGSSFSP